jgi:hypothetical protein
MLDTLDRLPVAPAEALAPRAGRAARADKPLDNPAATTATSVHALLP